MADSTMNRLAPTRVELEIPLSAEEIAAAQERAFRRLVRNVRLPGFRPGKVPRRVFEQTYGTDAIMHEAIDDLAPAAYERALREHDVQPLGSPTIDIVPEEDGKPLRLLAKVEVRPPIELGNYKGITVDVPAIVVTDDDVQRSLEAIARERATLVPVDRPARLGDVVTIDYEGRIDGETFEGGSSTGQVTELTEQRFIPGFAAGIAGMSAGQTKTVDATFPNDYAKRDLSGKTVSFTVTLHDVKEVELPELDDAFAKAASEDETIEELRADVRRRLEAIAAGRRRRAIGNAVMKKLLQQLDFPVPDGLLEREIDSMLADFAQTAGQMQIGLNEYLKQIGKTQEELRAEYRGEALSRVKGTLAIEAIAKVESIEATPADVTEEIEALARQYGQPPERIRKALGRKLESLKDGIVRNKALEFLIDHAEVRDREATPSPAS